jgi:hypothetical protein
MRITCDCNLCETNAAKIGASFPLAAEVNEATAAALKITARTAGKASKTHGLVHMAHDPSLRGYKGPLPVVAVA